MTNREFYVAIASNETLSAEIVEFANDAIAKMDATNAKRRDQISKKAKENQPMIEALVAGLTNEPQTASDLKDALGISVQKCSTLLRAAVAQGLCQVTDVKVAKKGTQKGYFVA
jgi:predicted Rossmann fold nucleotide-binding protein DprA/Smf involved in DNA uptake